MPSLFDMAWSSPTRKTITSIVTTLTALCAFVVAVPPAWSALGLWTPASREYVDHKVRPVEWRMAQTAAAVYQLTLTQLESALYAAQHDPAAATSPVVQQRIEELQRQIAAVQRQLETSEQPPTSH